MSANTEIEKRYQVIGADLTPFLNTLTFIDSNHILDDYFDTSEGTYYRNGIYIRLRNNDSLDIKFNPDHIGDNKATYGVSCSEYNFKIPLIHESNLWSELNQLIGIKRPESNSLQSFLNTNSLAPLVTLEKTRHTYMNDLFIIAIDYLKEFGTFIEFESKDHNQSVEEFMQNLFPLIQNLPIKAFDWGYVELALKIKNEELYKQGKYVVSAQN